MLCAIWTLQWNTDEWAWHHLHCTTDGEVELLLLILAHFSQGIIPPVPNIHTLAHGEKSRHTASLEFHCKPTINILAHQALSGYQNMSRNSDSFQSPEGAQAQN